MPQLHPQLGLELERLPLGRVVGPRLEQLLHREPLPGRLLDDLHDDRSRARVERADYSGNHRSSRHWRWCVSADTARPSPRDRRCADVRAARRLRPSTGKYKRRHDNFRTRASGNPATSPDPSIMPRPRPECRIRRRASRPFPLFANRTATSRSGRRRCSGTAERPAMRPAGDSAGATRHRPVVAPSRRWSDRRPRSWRIVYLGITTIPSRMT